ncbi:MAG: glutamate--tRNA ligase [bacterium]|nr:glutamate--tRNA ligase [bacterium]
MIRARFAPSPTGFLHIGTVRTVLVNILFARRNNGVVVCRIEDTDKERSKKEYEDDIMEGLKWLGMDWDEGPDCGGQYAPYRQSERTDIYERYLQKLLDQRSLYHCFCTEEELEFQRKQNVSNKNPQIYNGTCAHLTDDEVKKRIESGASSVLRFRIPPEKIHFEDLVRGRVEFDGTLIGDVVVAKDTHTPLYGLAVVIDDHEMKITHVIRGEEHLSNTPKQVLFIKALGFSTPIYAHIPLILNPDRSKMSKRKNKVSLLDYRAEGYLPEALINFLALLGWNPGTEQEIFSLPELIEQFSFERVQKSGAIFNIEKLQWLNSHYIRALPINELTSRVLPHLFDQGYLELPKDDIMKATSFVINANKETISRDLLEKYIALEQDRAKVLSEIPPHIAFCLTDTLEYDPHLLSWKDKSKEETCEMLGLGRDIIKQMKDADFTTPSIEMAIKTEITNKGLKNGAVLWPLRVALSGQQNSPGPFEIADALGKEKTLERIANAISFLINFH